MFKKIFMLTAGILFAANASALNQTTVDIKQTTKPYASLGTITFENSQYGLLIMPHLRGLTPGLHGLHIHVNPSCAKNGAAAGGHLDPMKTGAHKGPYAGGHIGDLPALFVNKNGIAKQTTLAPRLQVDQLLGHSVMVHAGGDNYADHPKPMGGGGARFACGVIAQ